MPELPEVETVRRGIAPCVEGKTVSSVELLHPRVNRGQQGPDLARQLPGERIAGVGRRGKYLWLELGDKAYPASDLDDPHRQVVFIHLGMSGQLRRGEPDSPHVRLKLHLSDGSTVSFIDQRTFGYWRLGSLADIAHIAPDPLERDFDPTAVARAIRRKRSPVKAVLLDQEVMSGIGNIYADEALWAARIHPRKKASALRQTDALRLVFAVHDVLAAALAKGGTSFDALYVNVNGESGAFVGQLQAYGRAGLECRRCGTAISKLIVAGRSSSFCPRCQGF